MTMNNHQRFLDQLPFYVNGTLTDADALWMREQLAIHTEWQSQIEFHQQLKASVCESVTAELEHISPTIGYARVAAWIAEENAARHRAGRSVWQKMGDALRGGFQDWRLAQGMALGLMLGVGTMSALRHGQMGDSGAAGKVIVVQAAKTNTDPNAPVTRGGQIEPRVITYWAVRFDPNVSAGQIQQTLMELGAQIVAGPDKALEYYLKVDPKRMAAKNLSPALLKVIQQLREVPHLPNEDQP
jgi:hypothetical protein